MKVLVLGGNGFIGSHLVDRLLADGHAVSVFDRVEERYRPLLEGVSYFLGDFGNRGLLTEALYDAEIVFHLISTSVPKTSNDDPVYDVQSNVIETLFMLDKCVAMKIQKLVFISSGGTVYGRSAQLPITEQGATEPECSYGITKLTIEKYLALYHHLHGLDYVVVRPANPYGSRQNPFGIQGAISVFLGKIAKGEPVEIWGDGEVVRDYLYIDDLIEGICRAAFMPARQRIFNLGSGDGVSLNRLLAVMQQVTQRDVKVGYLPARSFDIPAIYLDISLAHDLLGWQPVTSLEEGIRRTWEFIQRVV